MYARLEVYLKITIMSTPSCSVMYINKANLDDLMSINNNGEKRSKSIAVLRKKGKLTLEDLKTMQNISKHDLGSSSWRRCN